MSLNSPGPGWLFCPADRPERFEKAAAAADVVILDLEDGCAAKDRPAARQALIDTPLDPARTVVRLNPSDTADHPLDLAALAKTPYTTVMLAKTESAEQVRALAPLDVVVLVETPLGALAVTEDGFAKAGAMIGGLKIPAAITQEGGYNVETIGTLLERFLNGWARA